MGCLQMTNEQINQKINENNDEIQKILEANKFTLNSRIRDLIEENKILQSKCEHSFKDGRCLYCYLEAK